MTPIKHSLCNDVLRKPDGMTEEECRDLHIMRGDNAFMLGDGPSVNSFWTPSAEETTPTPANEEADERLLQPRLVVPLPCPFCGGGSSINQGYYGSSKEENYGVSCDECGSTEGGCRALNEGEEYAHKTPEEAWDAWNNRHNAHVMAPGSAVTDSESTNQDGR